MHAPPGSRRAVDVLVVGGGATGAGILRDLARRGLRGLLVERGDFGGGTTGRYHGLLHSGARYVGRDPAAARECIAENAVLRRIAPAAVEDTGGWFVATPDDREPYVDAFPGACAAAGVPCDEVALPDLFAREPALSRRIRRAFRVPDAALDPWRLVDATLADARRRGSEAWPYHRVVGFGLDGGRIVAATLRDERSGSLVRVAPAFVVSAAGAWAGRVAALAGLAVPMTPGKGTMLVYAERMTRAVVNRCHPPGDGDIMVPIGSVAILGTTDEPVADPDACAVTPAEVARLVEEGARLFPALPGMPIARAYAGVRPLYRPEAADTAGRAGGDRALPRSHAVLDHAPEGVANLVSVVGGKVTTHRRMAEEAVDLVAPRLGVTVPCTTAEEVLPDPGAGRASWAGADVAGGARAGRGAAG